MEYKNALHETSARYRIWADVFEGLAHPVHLRILDDLATEESCVCHLTAVLGKRQPYVSQQLMKLRETGLVQDRRDGVIVHAAGSIP